MECDKQPNIKKSYVEVQHIFSERLIVSPSESSTLQLDDKMGVGASQSGVTEACSRKKSSRNQFDSDGWHIRCYENTRLCTETLRAVVKWNQEQPNK